MSYRGPVTTNLDPVINYISNGRAYDSTIGWATYADAAGTQPVDGTGGSPSVTWSRDTTTPLRQGADFNFVKDAVNRQGQGVSYDFTIDNADLAKVLTVTFDYEVLSGTYATGDLTVYLVQDTGGTPTVVQPAGYQIQSATVGTKMRQIATFQTSSSITSYRLCLHVASTSASAYSLAVDNVVVGPQVVQYGAPVTDSTPYTPTGSWVSNSTYTGTQRRVGDRLVVEGKIALTGAPNSVSLSINLPSGLSIDTSKIGTDAGNITIGSWSSSDTGVANYTGLIRYNNTTSVICIVSEASATYLRTATVDQVTPFTWGNTDYLNFKFDVPILGWSSSVQMSNDTDTRVVAAKYGTSVAGTIGTASPFRCDTKTFDTHGAVTTGAAWKYTAPVPGFYKITALIAVSTAGDYLYIYKNGTNTGQTIGACTNATALSQSGIIELFAGDYVDIRTGTNQTVIAKTESFIAIERLSGPSAIAASESVNAKYTISTATQAPGALTQFNFDNRVFDSHGAVTTGAGAWRFTAPVSGTYTVLSQLYASSGNSDIWLYVNGTSNTIMAHVNTAATPLSGATMVRLNAGEYIDIRPQSAITVAGGSTPYKSHVSIAKVGN